MTARHARTGGGLLTVASCLLVLLAAAQGYVSFRAQYTFVDHAKRAPIPSTLEALGLDTGAVIFALLALSLARRGRSGTVERVLNVACALGSLTMNLLAADLTSPRSVTVWVMPSALYALASDRRHRRGAALGPGQRPVRRARPGRLGVAGGRWPGAVGAAAVLRRAGDGRRVPPLGAGRRTGRARHPRRQPASTPAAAALTVATAPARHCSTQPGAGRSRAPGTFRGQPRSDRPPGDGLAPGETKRAALIRLYERCGQNGDPRYGNRAKSAALAGEIASRIGYHPGTARRELARYLAEQSARRVRSSTRIRHAGGGLMLLHYSFTTSTNCSSRSACSWPWAWWSGS